MLNTWQINITLNHTVWPFGIDQFQLIPPFHYYENNVIDCNGQVIRHFDDFPWIFEFLRSKSIKIGVASRTKFPSGAYKLIELFDWFRWIDYHHIYPGKKIKHFERIREECGFNFDEMIFFDDEERNINDVGQNLGVFSVLVPSESGATKSIVIEALQKFTDSRDSKS
ncbi:magnesium-dependent phosphatase 1-like protein [Sarcoptes scabiei]|uniref:Magnesium-dependent phosphatase 1-like protein n=1 Tax=Sarcoptes scabiei TaxID=52283 RepID=A0A131ZWC5_SARSC|nr:magnesium-dependent phosphatase 1-like protein [Sarcoptes scabiei]